MEAPAQAVRSNVFHEVSRKFETGRTSAGIVTCQRAARLKVD